MTAMKIIRSFILCFVFSINQVLSQECVSALGMEDRRIKDSQITTSSVLKDKSPYGYQARLNQSILPWGGWCPDVSGGKIYERSYDQYIEIDLLNLTRITGIATQGREYSGGREYVKNYKISYRRDIERVWNFYQEKDQTVKIFKGNTDVSTVVGHNLDPAIMARYIRVHPGYYTGNGVCMRLELYGCVPVTGKDILSYSMPVGQTTKNGKVTFDDTSYNEVIENNILKDGTGILADVPAIGNEKISIQDCMKGACLVTQTFTTSTECYNCPTKDSPDSNNPQLTIIIICLILLIVILLNVGIFLLYSRQVFCLGEVKHWKTNKEIYMKCGMFNHRHITSSGIFVMVMVLVIGTDACGGGRNPPSKPSPIPKPPAPATQTNVNTRHSQGTTVPASGNKKTSFQDCVKGDCMATQSSTTSSVVPFTTSSVLTSECSNCPTKAPNSPEAKDSRDSSNLQMTIIIICVILLIVILLLVIIFLLYRRRVYCFGKMKHWKTNKDQDGEIPMSERSPDAQDHGIPINDETGPYEEVSNLPHSVYAKLDRNRRVEKTSDSTYQKLLKPCSEYAIPANVDESSYEFVPDSSPSVYAELKRNPENTSDNTYQKLLKPASDYVIPAENDLYEEVGKKKSPPEYTELDQTKREDADASYQKLLKK